MTTVYVSIDNSDDTLSQAEWNMFHRRVNSAVRAVAPQVYGDWVSPSTDQYQNACIAFEVGVADIPRLKRVLLGVAGNYRQDSIAWAVVPETQFLAPKAPYDA